jgi:hypothetical protein
MIFASFLLHYVKDFFTSFCINIFDSLQNLLERNRERERERVWEKERARDRNREKEKELG